MKKLIVTLLVIDIVLSVAVFILFKREIFISFEVAFLSSSLVILSSFSSYKSMVEGRLALIEDAPPLQRDAIEEIEDPYSLYDDEEPSSKDEDIKEVIKQERERLKSNRDIKKSIKNSKSFFNPIKIISYALLAVGFISLKRANSLEIFVYLISLAIPIIIAVWVLLNQELNNNVTEI